MELKKIQAELEQYQSQIAQLLGEPVRFFELPFDTERFLLQHARRQGVKAFANAPLMQSFYSNSRWINFGMKQYLLTIGGVSVPAVHLFNRYGDRMLREFWAVPARHLPRVYRFLRRGMQTARIAPLSPIMCPQDAQRLWDNTLGFLQRTEAAFNRFGVTFKRGVLLLGEPGNGKTLAARWLQSRADSLGLEWKAVTAQDYMSARSDGDVSSLFQLERSGIILFDDFDVAIRNRDHVGADFDCSTFLTELDGITPHTGVVYLFTSNARLNELDPAFRRPGRIDQVIHFARPDAELRRMLIQERWPQEIVSNVPAEEIVAETDGCSFAEVDEIKKLLVLHYLETECWDWSRAWQQFQCRGDESRRQRPLGFAACMPTTARSHDLAMKAEGSAE